MDGPLTEVELVPEEEKIEDGTEGGPALYCDLCDIEVVHKIAQEFIPGLATACVDHTTGDMFRSPGSVTVEIRNEMIDYLIQRSESFVADTVIIEGSSVAEVSDHPHDIVSNFVDDFASSKRNFFSRVSGWLLSEKREDKIDDFVQEMEIAGFWLLDRREAIAKGLVKNVDFKNIFHCDKKFGTPEELAEHVTSCGFRPMRCTNDGCSATFCASHMEKHDSVCPFKIIPCEQNCSDSILRREMDRHCITVCPMKLVNCPFYAVGCQSSIPQCMTQQHISDDLHYHLLYILQNIHKGASSEDLKQRADQLVHASSGQVAEARDVRSLTVKIKDLETKLGPLEVHAAERRNEKSKEATKNNHEHIQATPVVNEELTVAANKVSEQPKKDATAHASEVDENQDQK